ncbi:Ku protein [Massilia jejuensis]|uniref:Non-homologous end joining protein Ku n=1 Tax=Massilia jejuensis TaxID=648894 RepID=A0ABW0PCC7_9BURK
MARSLWKGAISFGLVHIPVEMYPATSNHALDLNMLDRRDFSPIGFKRYNKNTGQEVGWDDIIKGYEYADGEYVVLSDEDLRRANPEATQTIDILAFVDAGDVPLIYYDQPYYLAPGKGGDKVYALLRDTLKKAGKIGIANVVIRVKQHLAALHCLGNAIVMTTLRYPDEIRDPADLKIPARNARNALSDKELKMAMALVEGMSEQWEPEQYHDTYREDVMALIDKKIKAKQTKTITMPDKDEKPARPTNVVDLVSLLQASLGKKPGKTASADGDDDDEPPPPKRAPRPAAADADEEAAPRARKTAGASRDKLAASAVPKKRATAGKAAARPAPKTAKAAAPAPARRKKAA